MSPMPCLIKFKEIKGFFLLILKNKEVKEIKVSKPAWCGQKRRGLRIAA